MPLSHCTLDNPDDIRRETDSSGVQLELVHGRAIDKTDFRANELMANETSKLGDIDIDQKNSEEWSCSQTPKQEGHLASQHAAHQREKSVTRKKRSVKQNQRAPTFWVHAEPLRQATEMEREEKVK